MKRILVMDASAEVRERTRHRLEAEGHTVVECDETSQVLQLFRSGATAVVMAATRESLNIEFLDEVRRAENAPSVIILSESIRITVSDANDDGWASLESVETQNKFDSEAPPRSAPRATEGALEAPSSLRDYRLPAEGISFADLERDVLAQALRLTRGNQTRAGVLLGLTRDQIRYRMAKFSLTSAHFGATDSAA